MEIGFSQTSVELFHQLGEAGWPTSDVVRVAESYRLAVDLTSAAYREAGKHFVHHLVGTASILAWCGHPTTVVNAGLLHSAYTYGDFGLKSDKRRVVRERVGAEVEELVWRYHNLPWSRRIVQDLASGADPIETVPRELLIMRLANELEDQLDHGLLYKPSMETRGGHGPAFRDELIQVARVAGQDDLAAAMEVALEEDARARIPEVLRSVHRKTWYVPPQYVVLHPAVAMRRVASRAILLLKRSVKRVLHLVGLR